MNHKELADLIIEYKSFEFSESILKEPNKYEVEFFAVFNNENLYKVVPSDELIGILIDELLIRYNQLVLSELNSIIRFSEWVFTVFNETPRNKKHKNHRFISNHLIPQILIDKGFNIQEQDLTIFQDINEGKKNILYSASKVIYDITNVNKIVFHFYKLCYDYKVDVWDSLVNNAQNRPLRTINIINENLYKFSNSYQDLLRGLLLGINKSNIENSYYLAEEIFKKKELQWIVINALTPLCNQNVKILERILNLVESCDLNDNNFKELAWLYTHIWIKNLRNTIGARCYKNLKYLVSLDNHIAQESTLQNLAYFEFPEKAIFSILRIFIDSPNFNEKGLSYYLNNLDDILTESIKSPFVFFTFLEELAQKIDFLQEKPFRNSILNYLQKESYISCSFIISSLYSNKGKKRVLGKYLLDLFINIVTS